MDLSYPIGRPEIPETIEQAHIDSWMQDVSRAPDLLRAAVSGLSEEQLDTAYRPEGWTVRQVVYHLGDTHMQTYNNFMIALTEENPVTRPVDINAWAANALSRSGSIGDALDFFESVQKRWLAVMQGMTREDFNRTFQHPRGGERPLVMLLAIYAWHGKHHTAHITGLRERMGW